MATATDPATDAPFDLEPAPPEVKRYQRLKVLGALASATVALIYLAVLALWLSPLLDPWFRSWLGESPWLRLLAVAVLLGGGMELLTLPFDFWSGFILEHRYGLSNQTIGRWIWKKIKSYLVGAPIGLILLFGLFALLKWTNPWWLWATLGWLGFTLVLGRLVPTLILPLFFKVTPLDDPEICGRLEKLAAGTGLKLTGVFRLHLSADTRKANAALAGLGKTRRVLLGDTLLESFSPEEIEVVFAHEVGHHVHRHLIKMVALSVVLAMAGLGLADLVLQNAAIALGYSSFNDPAALPLVLLVLSLFGLILTPLLNVLSRHFERQCDRYALDRTQMPLAYRSAFVKLARMNKSDPDPNRLVVLLFYDHPPIRERLAMAVDGALRQRVAGKQQAVFFAGVGKLFSGTTRLRLRFHASRRDQIARDGGPQHKQGCPCSRCGLV